MGFGTKLAFLFLLLLANCEWIEQLSAGNNDQVMAYRRFVKDKNEKGINEFNSQRKGHTLWANPDFIYYTNEEIRAIYGNKQMQSSNINGVEFKVGARNRKHQHPSQILRNYSNIIVNNSLETGSAKHQGRCGGCYSFAANNVLNYAFNKYYQQPVNASIANLKLGSEQEIIECSTENAGCDGGWPHLALRYIRMNAINTDKRYKYRAQTYYSGQARECEFYRNTSLKVGKEMNLHKSVIRASQTNTITSLIAIIDAYKVAAIGVYSLHFNFIYYKNGTIEEAGDGEIDHAVTLVGYIINHETQVYAWIVKNSWGVRWGISGHCLISMAKDTASVQSYVSYVTTS